MNLPLIGDLLEDITNDWRLALINTNQVLYETVEPTLERRWRSPPLCVGDDKVDALLQAFHYQPSSDAEVVQAWEEACAAMKHTGGARPFATVARIFNKVFPETKFASATKNPLALAIQFLKIASWHPGRTLEIDRGYCILDMGDTRIGISVDILRVKSGSRLTRMAIPSPTAVLQGDRELNRGKLPKGSKTNGVFKMLTRTLPDAVGVGAVVAVAVHAGKEFENLLCANFDVTPKKIRNKMEPAEALASAKRVLDRATDNPLLELYELLCPVIGAKRFTKEFGNPYQRIPDKYTVQQQQRHASALSRLMESAEPVEVVKEDVADADVASTLAHLYGL